MATLVKELRERGYPADGCGCDVPVPEQVEEFVRHAVGSPEGASMLSDC